MAKFLKSIVDGGNDNTLVVVQKSSIDSVVDKVKEKSGVENIKNLDELIGAIDDIGGSGLYTHDIRIIVTNINVGFVIISSNNTPMTGDDIAAYLQAHHKKYTSQKVACGTAGAGPIYGVFSDYTSGPYIKVSVGTNFSQASMADLSTATIYDTVTAI